ncbi:glycerol-3-phosphate dehydrogenase (NAD(P)+) [Alkalithermobacter thermoalcaliphilus JW-YL-7 = DSM 7308]|uniref:Glycerol-3-phosphate dehydrogenase [NAD(P)+] n=1 Tax=Alkalithermobacter thermoalcaliphilus JW-YL-7 = DSM 7308 TaxID=1121328 RepID=A0A150FRA0_CLOPD|nr:Glycerol-3-phosphate dehydrogenase (NAD(P)+) [[Clostridium] paradoxum JW-YL-7 = DSM 7308]SHK97573.1 glycerol-3-phosphate dehydrogenase (NAD(P)+) [[Clostridium] paradoxum JW-YL-7 = DSM 7308]
MEKICVLGAGSFGTSLAILLTNKNEYNVVLWTRDKKQYDEMLNTRKNENYLKDIYLPEKLSISIDLESSLQDSNVILLAVPSQAVRSVLRTIKPYVKDDQIIVNVAKGLEKETGLRISEIVKQELPNNKYVVLSGPSHAEEIAKEVPTAIVSSSQDIKVAEYIQNIFSTSKLRVYTNPDVIGVELGGALKNIIAFGAGIADGLGCGDNTKAALMTRGIREIARLGIKMGAKLSTFSGLSGIGDLIVTCTSMHSRNRRAGILIGQGKSLDETLHEIKMVVEGITATQVAYELSKKYNVDMPITKEIYKVLYEKKDVKECIENLMLRDKAQELEEVVLEKLSL